MKLLALAILFPFFLAGLDLPCTYKSSDWIECDKIYITRHSPSQEDLVMWMNTYSQPLYPVTENYPYPGDWSACDRWMEKYGWIGKPYPHDEWVTVSVADRVPKSAKAIFLSGILLISSGTKAVTGNMTLMFRRKGETEEYKYVHQACICSVPEMARTMISLWVPLDKNCEFEFKWTRSTTGDRPEYPAYGMAIALNAWAK